MTTIFPPKLQKILDKAVLHLWDKAIPLPDLSSLEEWLETDGWDDVVSGIQGSYIHLSEALEFFNDEVRIPYQSGHRFQANVATQSRPIRPPIPRQSGHHVLSRPDWPKLA